MITFKLIYEGRTDYLVIENILYGYFNTVDDIVVDPLHPKEMIDETHQHRLENKTGWGAVLKYCQSAEFKQAFQSRDYFIIHIDTDTSPEKHFDISHSENGKELSPEDLIEKVIEKFKELMGREFYAQYQHRIIFAIAVHSTECWLLPLYYQDNKRTKTKGCLRTLNQALLKKEGFSIDENAKRPEYYEKISANYGKHKELMKLYQRNPSLRVFIEQLQQREFK